MKLLCPLSTAAASLLFLWAVILPAAENPSPVLTAGLAKIDITPRVPVRMVGYASRDYEGQPTKGRLFARALVIGSGGKAESLMITADLLGIPRSLSDRVFERVEKRLGLTREQFAISATHTHGGPSLSQYMQETHFCADLTKEQKKHIDEYTDWLVERFEEIAVEAAGKLQPAVLRWGEGYASFAMNRRVIQNGKWIGMRPNPTGSVDHRVPMLTVARADDEHSILGVFLSYACHCTSYAPPRDSFHGDWAEAASTEIERRHPGSVALVAAGCGADANPDPRTARAAPFIEKHGREIASQVDWLLAHRESSLTLTSPPKGKLRTVSLPLATQPGREDFVKWTQGKDKRRAYYGQMWLDRLDAGQTVPKSFDYLVQTWRFAADQERCLTTVFLPGEVVSDYALRIRDELDTDARKHWVIGYANESPCYITTAQQNAEGGYEVEQSMISYDKTSPLAPETEDLIVGAVAELSGGEPNTPQTIPPRPLPNDQPLSPEQGLASMHVPAGFKVELAAAEPLVMDPVSLDWGPDGRLWVAEMRDYPNGFTWNGAGDPLNEPGGRIKVLTDTDGDGRYDKAEVFLDGLHYPSSVKVWNRGVLVTAAPEIFYAEDTDGDGKADLRETWFSGFARSNQQHRVNSLAWGLDNWLHVANGDGGGLIESEKGRDKVDIRGFDLRIDPFSREIQPLLGRTQCGRYRNDWGDWFGCNNSNPLWHYPLPWDRLQRNANLTAPRAFVDVPREPGAAPVYPLSETLARFNQPDRANRFTSACGPTIYRDRVLALGTAENAFVCEPVHNLVSRQVLTPQGATFSSERAPGESKSEFFASTDTWSRPVSVRTGPDGALWIADMYRLVIEHPEWIPKEWQDKLELRAGHDGGRIYRVVPASGASPKVPRFDALDAAGLVDQLESPNGTVRDLAHQMLLWRPSDEAVPRLQEKARSGKNPAARLHALCVLDGLGKLDADTVRAALADAHPGVVRHAVRLSVGRMGAGELAEIVASRLDDAAVALEVAGVLDTKDEAATRLLAALLLRHRDEPYVTAVALSSVNRDNLKAVLDPLLLAYNDTHAFQKRLGDWDANLQAPPDQLIQTLARFAAMWKVDAAIDAIVATLA
ncbi:MAG: neutral/alkaline non-lysosomal ceramidase N-terminal domain-containing protein, partial [Verrucomicrobiales bacterium]|nr:neutral/alkaline non-lysosomal ceramidase N-terminal domain-containing protein [Verrucomicrobiales bacterium]